MQGYVIRHDQPEEIAYDHTQQYLFQITDSNSESTCRDTPQKYLNAIHDANLILQRGTEAYETIKAANELSEQGFQKRKELCEESRNNPEFFLNFGPAGDLPIHLACLLQDGQLGIDMLEAVQDSDKIGAYWSRCNELIAMYGKDNMPARPGKGEKCPHCHCEKCKHMLHKFIINIPYQNDIIWWLKEIERRKDSSGEGGVNFEKLLPSKIRQQMEDKGREAGLFSGLCVCRHFVVRQCDFLFLFRENLIEFVCVCVCCGRAYECSCARVLSGACRRDAAARSYC